MGFQYPVNGILYAFGIDAEQVPKNGLAAVLNK
jgi:hypothetical protein